MRVINKPIIREGSVCWSLPHESQLHLRLDCLPASRAFIMARVSAKNLVDWNYALNCRAYGDIPLTSIQPTIKRLASVLLCMCLDISSLYLLIPDP